VIFLFVLFILDALHFYFSLISFVMLGKLFEENMFFDEQK